mmetsp:Transcript_26823/g.64351  ORF Transcript_26823/g.64351 Transcript_26823/m.64351 type:complete len:264 (+) Transcript_26823:2611-3402(+)
MDQCLGRIVLLRILLLLQLPAQYPIPRDELNVRESLRVSQSAHAHGLDDSRTTQLVGDEGGVEAVGDQKVVRLEAAHIVGGRVVDLATQVMQLRAELDAHRGTLGLPCASRRHHRLLAISRRRGCVLQNFGEGPDEIVLRPKKQVRSALGKLVPVLFHESLHVVLDQARVVMYPEQLLCHLTRIGLEPLVLRALLVHGERERLVTCAGCSALIVQHVQYARTLKGDQIQHILILRKFDKAPRYPLSIVLFLFVAQYKSIELLL